MDAVAVLQTVMSAIQSGAVNLNVSDSAAAGNATAAVGSVASFSPLQLPSIISMVLSFSAVRDWIKLLLLGAVVETCRRVLTKSYYGLINYFWITATFDGNDECVGAQIIKLLTARLILLTSAACTHRLAYVLALEAFYLP